jgi:phage shock protein A
LPPVAEEEPPQPETVTITKHEYEELHSVIEEYKTESEATEAVFDADDKVSAAVAEIRKLTAKVALLETQKTGLQNQANELKRSSVSKDRQIAKLTKELDTYKLAAVGL